jgi:hypothetical protein
MNRNRRNARLVLSALAMLALVGCGSATPGIDREPLPQQTFVRGSGAVVRASDAEQIRAGLPRAAVLPEAHTGCSVHRSAPC